MNSINLLAETLILDTAPLLNITQLTGLSKQFYTVPEVILEIKDQAARTALTQSHIDIIQKQPEESSVLAIIEFSKKTGDYPSLSRTDIKVLALLHTIHQQNQRRIEIQENCVVDLIESIEKHGINDVDLNDFDLNEIKSNESNGFNVTPPCSNTDDDSEGEWITPKNINRKSTIQPISNSFPMVACMTSDFAMQNVILQMKMNLVSLNGTRITELKTHVLRCHGCYMVTKEMEKKFCPRCGNATLIRTSMSVNTNGKVIYHLKKNFQYRNRGTVYAIPAFKGGKHCKDLILREDQKEFLKQKPKSRVESFFEDCDLSGGGKDYLQNGPVVGYGRRNPNEKTHKRK